MKGEVPRLRMSEGEEVNEVEGAEGEVLLRKRMLRICI